MLLGLEALMSCPSSGPRLEFSVRTPLCSVSWPLLFLLWRSAGAPDRCLLIWLPRPWYTRHDTPSSRQRGRSWEVTLCFRLRTFVSRDHPSRVPHRTKARLVSSPFLGTNR